MATKKATPAQLAARKLFAERAKAGLLKKKPKASRDYARDAAVERAEAQLRIAKKAEARRKANPSKKTVSQKISQLVHEGYPQRQAVAVALSEQRAGKVKRNPTSIKALENSIYWQKVVLKQSNDQKQKERVARAIERLEKELEVAKQDERKKNPAHRKVSAVVLMKNPKTKMSDLFAYIVHPAGEKATRKNSAYATDMVQAKAIAQSWADMTGKQYQIMQLFKHKATPF